MPVVLPSAPDLTEDGARRLVAAAVPRWVGRFLVLGWLVAIGIAFVTDPGVCDPTDPSVCAPDHVFAWAFVLALATPVLLLWMPMLGCVVGIAFALADLRFDPIDAAHPGFAVHGAACALAALAHLRAITRQRAVFAELTHGRRVPVPAGAVMPSVHKGIVAACALLVLVAAGSLGWERHEVLQERQHLQRAVTEQAQVVQVHPDDYELDLEIADGLDQPRRVRVEVLDTSPYAVGSEVALRLDPRDPSWHRLVAEPQDATGWEGLAYGCLLLAAVLLGRQLRRRQALRRLLASDQPAVRVELAPDPTGDLLLRTGPSGPLLGRFYPSLDALPDQPPGDEDDEDSWQQELADFGRVWRGEASPEEEQELTALLGQQAVLLGDIRDRGWCALALEDAVVLPSGPLRTSVREGSRRDALRRRLPGLLHRLVPEPPDVPEDEGFLPGEPVVERVRDLQLPLEASLRPRARLRAVLEGLAIALATPAFVLVAEASWFQDLAIAFGGAAFLSSRLGPAFHRVVLAHDRLALHTGGWVYLLPWERLVGVRRERDRLYLALEEDEVVELSRLVAGERVGEQAAEHVGAAMMTLRDRSLAAGSPGREPIRRRGPMLAVMAVYVVVVAAALWAR